MKSRWEAHIAVVLVIALLTSTLAATMRNIPRAGRADQDSGITVLDAPTGTVQLAPTNETFNIRIAAVEPDFTATAYSSFYTFYRANSQTPPNQPVRKDLSLLNATLVRGWQWSQGLYQYLNSTQAAQQGLQIGRNLVILPETNVSQGELFTPDGQRRYDAVILGFTEYVTSKEYNSYMGFVSTGGVLIILDATNFLAEVRYYPATQHLALVRGHSWAFNGTVAWRDIADRWRTENTNWTGGTFGVGSSSGARYKGAIPFDHNPIGRALKKMFGTRVFTSYTGHEENTVVNMTRTSIIAHFLYSGQSQSPPRVAAYLHNYKKSYIIHFGGMASDVIRRDPSVQAFLTESLRFAQALKNQTGNITYCNEPYKITFTSNTPTATTTIHGYGYGNGSTGLYNYQAYIASTTPPPGYTFKAWSSKGGVDISDNSANPTDVVTTCQGTLETIFQPQQSTTTLPAPVQSLILILAAGTVLIFGSSLRGRLRQHSHPPATKQNSV